MRTARSILTVVLMLLVVGVPCWSRREGVAEAAKALKYGHPNAPTSNPGRQATLFAKLVEEKTKGELKIRVYPSSQLGTLAELTEGTKLGTIDFSHNTFAALGSLYKDYEIFDAPYIYRDVDHLMRVTAPNSSIMQDLNKKLVQAAGVRVVYTFYFGKRQMTSNVPIYRLADLRGVKIRAIPWPVYIATVECMGAIATPIDFSELPAALASGMVAGQENPLTNVYANKMYESQKYLILTEHIISAMPIIVNEKVWQSIPEGQQKAVIEAGAETAAQALRWNLQEEEELIGQLQKMGMKVIDPKSGLRLEEFREQVSKCTYDRFSGQWGDLYRRIRAF